MCVCVCVLSSRDERVQVILRVYMRVFACVCCVCELFKQGCESASNIRVYIRAFACGCVLLFKQQGWDSASNTDTSREVSL